jgi:transposase
LQAAGIVHGDETGWRVGRINAWLWVFCTGTITIYVIAKIRGHEVPEAILGEDFDGILIVDGWSAYDVLGCQKGRCTGHIIGRSKELKKQPLAEQDQLRLDYLLEVLRLGRELAAQREQLSEEEYQKRQEAWESELFGWLLFISEGAGPEVEKLSQHLWEHKEELMLHVKEPGVPATNDLAERQLRPAVVVRKAGGCNKTGSGALVHMVLASLMASLRQQGKRFVDLALPLWHSVEPVALDLEALPAVVEGELQQRWPQLSPETIWPVPLAASG